MSRKLVMLLTVVFLAATVLLVAAPAALHAGAFERVPQDGTLQDAIDAVDDRGVIEIADGVYPAPTGGFEIDRLGKSFTVRAADGATVVLDGGGLEQILFFRDTGAGLGRRVSFERLTFRGGFSNDEGRGGGVTVQGADAVFVSSTFEDNEYPGTSLGGGAVQIREGSYGRFTNCVFTGNSAFSRGAAIYVLDSKADVTWSEFTDNRTNLPGHSPVSAAGAIFVLDFEAPADTEVSVMSSRFEGNEAGFNGGAINGFGAWHEPESNPAVRITIVNSTFVDNRAQNDPCCQPPGGTFGGAVHIEDHVTLEIKNSRFEENSAQQGGALSSYRALMEVSDSVFRGNRATLPETGLTAAGGTIVMFSADGVDPSTDDGAINRRNAELTMTDSFVQGRFGATGVAGRQGGCLFANGDVNRMDGLGGVPQDGTETDNRAVVALRDVVFADCDVERDVNGAGRGGAIMTILADLTMDNVLITDSDAFGDGATGGAINAFDRSALRIDGSTFAGNSAEQSGGAILANGGEVEISDCFFLENDVSPGVAEPVQGAQGAALTMSPNLQTGEDITGVVEDSLFVANVGLPILDSDRTNGPFNLVRYDGNDFLSTTFGAVVYRNPVVSNADTTVPQLNSLVINRGGGNPPTDKSQRANTRLTAIPDIGRLVAAPSRVLSANAAGDPAPPTSAFLGYAWIGNGSAMLAGSNLADLSGFEEVTADGTYNLRVANQTVADATVGTGGCSDGRLLCLRQDRFLLEVDWRDFVGNTGNALAVADTPSNDSGLYFFFGADNWEILLKILNACGFNQHYWMFSAATTNVEYTLRVTDTLTGFTKSYFNPLGNAADAVTDTSALQVCDAMSGAPEPALGAPSERRLFDELKELVAEPTALPTNGLHEDGLHQDGLHQDGLHQDGLRQLGPRSCTPSETNLCLNNSRFKLEVTWRDFEGNTGSGEVVPFGTDASGIFFFFDADNWEMLVKVLNGCGFNQHYWLFSAATTNVEYRLTVTDTDNGEIMEYFNPLGTAAPAVTDTSAFETCP